uniref:phosphopyruvate hydratase n=1 Tax=Saimiri boliviensis boliviensis TaxID=39432 RepID=A0A2K6SRX1_SAIBB
MSILKIHAREILDSYGNPTVEVDLFTSKGLFRAAVSSGASTGIYEALVLQDNDKTCYMGKGVSKAVEHINKTVVPTLVSKKLNVTQQDKIDKLMIGMDGTESKSKFGANAILRVSLTIFILLVLAFNLISGGSHAGNKLVMQEFIILPVGAVNFREAMRIGVEVYHNLKNVIKEKYRKVATKVGDEGKFAPNILEHKEAGHTDKVVIGMDVAASEFFRSVKYDLDFKSPNDPNRYVSADQLADLYKSFIKDYPVVSTEDLKFMASAGIQVVGDNLTVTNPRRIAKVMNKKSCNYLLLKGNQIGSLTKSLQACKLAHANGWSVMVSHHSGETEDTFFTNLYLAKYNQLLRIEEELGSKPTFAGRNFRNPLAK